MGIAVAGLECGDGLLGEFGFLMQVFLRPAEERAGGFALVWAK